MFIITFLSTFIISSSICYYIDTKYCNFRINKPKNNAQIIKKYTKAIPLVSVNLSISAYYIILCERYLENRERSKYIFRDLFLWLILSDIAFYSIHYLFHTKYLYPLHLIHHQYIDTIGLTALYAHPLDYIFSNLIPITFPILLFKFEDFLIQWIIIFSLSYTVIISHGGYKFLPKAHILHHLHRRVNYGLAFTDKLMGTNL